jgi:DNA-directed RNA polymerase I subunit RPA1
MAGREGLIDTAVKTSRSGYLQRCLIKNLESLKVHFDGSVRDDSDGNIVQFSYGDDGLDVTLTPYIYHFGFLGRNIRCYNELFKTLNNQANLSKNEGLTEQVPNIPKTSKDEPVINVRKDYINDNFVCKNAELSRSYEEALDIFIKTNPERIIKGKIGPHSATEYQKALRKKYIISNCAAGEAVGVIAAQAIGEPSTQMTLNTFHMAGRGETNVTLGIPRLREIILTAAKHCFNQVMNLPLLIGTKISHAFSLTNGLRALRLAECLSSLYMVESIVNMDDFHKPMKSSLKLYRLHLVSQPKHLCLTKFGISYKHISKAINGTFRRILKRKLYNTLYRNREFSSEYIKISNNATDKSNSSQSSYIEKKNHSNDITNSVNKNISKNSKRHNVYTSYDKTQIGLDHCTLQTHKKTDISPLTQNSLNIHTNTNDFNENVGCHFCLDVRVGLKYPKILMLEVVETAAAQTDISHLMGINSSRCMINDDVKPLVLKTEGINFHAAWFNAHIVDVCHITTTDVGAMYAVYGIEAARNTLIQEVNSVFTPYGIEVDHRHLSLISDSMTNQGFCRPCNRLGIDSSASPFLKMSFETATKFLVDATSAGNYDNLESPAARNVTGKVVNVGTGFSEILYNLNHII